MRALASGVAAAVATALAAAVAAVGVHVLRRRLAVVAVIGLSMQPTLVPGDRVLVRRVGIGDIRAGQIVVIEKPGDDGVWPAEPRRRPTGQREWMIKRVAAIPGDPRPGMMPADGDGAGHVVPSCKLVVLGDNPARSMDSRQIGYIPADRVLGVVLRSMHHAGGAARPGK
jgi:signal peptidase I